jgi:hypothetical protein
LVLVIKQASDTEMAALIRSRFSLPQMINYELRRRRGCEYAEDELFLAENSRMAVTLTQELAHAEATNEKKQQEQTGNGPRRVTVQWIEETWETSHPAF